MVLLNLLFNNLIIIILIFIINSYYKNNVFIYIINYFFFVIFTIKTVTISYLEHNSNILNYTFNKLALLWSTTENNFLIYFIFLNLFLIYFYYSYNKNIKIYFINNEINTFYSLCVLFILLLYNISEYHIENNFLFLTFNIILDNTFLVLHPPLILGATLILKYLIYFELFHTTFNIKNKTYLLIFIILSFGIITGSLWSSYLFGWGGWWIWDPIENISIFYWIVLILLFHINRTNLLRKELLLFIFFYDYLFFFLFRLNFLSSLHIFKTNIFYINFNFFIYIFLIFVLFFFILLFVVKNIDSLKFINILIFYSLFFLLCTFLIQNINLISIVNINSNYLNILYFYLLFMYLFEYYVMYIYKYNLEIFRILIMFLLLLILFFYSKYYTFTIIAFFILFLILFINFISEIIKYNFFYYIHFFSLFILILLIFYPILERNLILNFGITFQNFYINNILLLNNINLESFLLKIGIKYNNYYYLENLYYYNNNSLNLNSTHTIVFMNQNMSHNEFFLYWNNWKTLLYQFIFISLKIQDIIPYFIVFLSIIYIISKYLFFYRKYYKFNNKIFYTNLIY